MNQEVEVTQELLFYGMEAILICKPQLRCFCALKFFSNFQWAFELNATVPSAACYLLFKHLAFFLCQISKGFHYHEWVVT